MLEFRPTRGCVLNVKKKKKLWSFSTKNAFKVLMCFVCEWPVDLVVKSALPVVASIHRRVYLRKQLPLCLSDPTPLLSTLDQWSEIVRWLACFCHCNEAKPRPEVSAVWFPNTLCMLKPLPLWNVPIPPPLLPSITLPFSPQTLDSVWMLWGSPSCLPPLLPPAFTSSFSLP